MRLWQRIFLVSAVLVLLATTALIALQQSRLERGLLGYLDRIEVDKARNVAALVLEDYRAHGGFTLISERPQRLGRLVEAGRADLSYAQIDWQRPWPAHDGRPPPPPPRDNRPPPWDGRDQRDGPPRPGQPPPPRENLGPPRPGQFDSALDYVQRFGLFDARGLLVAGNPKANQSAHIFPLLLATQKIGELRLVKLPNLNTEWDRHFVDEQLRASILLGLVILAIALLASIFLARLLTAPLRALSQTAQRIADGDFSARSSIKRADEIGELAQTFDRTAQALEQARDARRRWTADISHELRTPVTVLRAEIQALEDGVRKADAAALASLSNEIERLTMLIEDLYQLSLSDIGALDYRFELLDFRDLVNTTVNTLQSSIALAGLHLRGLDPPLATDAAAHPWVRADARRLAQVLANILSNSVRYTDRHGQIVIALARVGEFWSLSIDDSAPGVAPDQLARLTEPLFRADTSRSRAHGGAGLGLAIANMIVIAHGGTLNARTSDLGGVRMEVLLPAQSQENSGPKVN